MISIGDIALNAAYAAAYSGVGVLLMLISFAVLDVLTPGNLRHQLWADRNRNAGILVATNLLSVAIIVTAAIVSSEGRLAVGLTYTVVYTIIGMAAMALTFVIVDLFTPGKLGELVVDTESHPAVWVHGVTHVGTALIIAASIL
ncbi:MULTISPECIES: DUF350 domain-containing protein [unclassified Gordonia (in: high G+C Gram-positive bacteria)]|uniref:DUF350 domain-containing protein n=1 Tax=unclassified Gordonia (in: high G+C Gram-positive bacteria) TaxID=2657482 RepID=UPI001F11773F|nr:DUF350 domain-containing protein [Gordonia sp. ABSL49_1]MCH5644038.1 DUF350 domain-containing protein [Gordonia sp. ABSL49_1]